MHRDRHDEELRDGASGAVISNNLQRIKDQIYGTAGGQPVSPRSGQRTSGRIQES